MSAPLSSRAAIALVARREFAAQVRSRSFVVGLLVTLVLFAVFGLVNAFVIGNSTHKSLGATASAATLQPAITQAGQTQGLQITLRPVDEAVGRAGVADGSLDGLLAGAPGAYQLIGRDGVDSGLESAVETAVREQTLSAALAGAGIDQSRLEGRSVVTTSTLEPERPDSGQQLAVALVGTILLFFSFSAYGQLVATGVVEEKQSRVVELLLATVKPWQLLSGKIIGLGAVGMLQLVILGVVGLAASAVFGLLTVPGAALGMFAMVIVWYLLGFFLFASLYAAIGSTVSRQEELNSVIAPMVFLIIIPFVLTLNLLPSDPRSELAAVLSFVPFFSQTVMPARYALGAAPLWQVGVSALIALAAIVVVVRLAGRVYRNSILRTGGRVKLRDALRAG
jgi:ABC-2 type transport system permease protein